MDMINNKVIERLGGEREGNDTMKIRKATIDHRPKVYALLKSALPGCTR